MATATQSYNRKLIGTAIDLLERSKPYHPRRLRQFAEEEIIVPTGQDQYRGRPFRCRTLPYTGLLLDEIDSGRWYTIIITGPSQSGKSLCGFVIPILHMVLERREDTGFACPEGDMHSKKWEKDFLPVMKASPKLRKFIPQRGPGSRGGSIRDAVHFPHGSSMLLFSRGGKDTNKAAVTLRTMHVTEAAGWSDSTETSKESGPLRQLAARMRGFPRNQRRLIVEGTTTTEGDLPWRMRGSDSDARLVSSQSRLAFPCPHCEAWITLERQHLLGWQDTESEDQAANEAYWCCPECRLKITEEQRAASNQDIRLLHPGQTVNRRGVTDGDGPRTSTLWFRWTQGNNLLTPAGDAAVDEWIAAQLDENSPEREKAEMELCQFVHAVPYQAKEFELTPLVPADINHRKTALGRGKVPEGARWLSRGIDCGQRRLHFVTRAWSVDENGIASGRAIDLGSIEVHSEQRGVRQSLFDALCEIRDKPLLNEFQDATGNPYIINHNLVDAGWMEDVVWAFIIDCHEKGIKGWMPVLGRGQSAPPGSGAYSHPTSITPNGRVLWIGEQCHIRKSSRFNLPFVMENSDEWKSFVHDGYKTPDGQTGALSCFEPATAEEEKLLKTYRSHLLAGKRQWKEVPKRGKVVVWVHSGSDDHLGDADAYCCVAGFLCGVRVATRDRTLTQPPIIRQSRFTMPDGRPFMEV